MGLNVREVAGRSALRHVRYEGSHGAAVTTTKIELGVVTERGKIKRFVVCQRDAGAGAGANFTAQLVRTRAGIAPLAVTDATALLTRAAGAGAAVDTKTGNGAIATPAGCTKPTLLASEIVQRVLPGDTLHVLITHDAAYGTPPSVECAVHVLPDL
jgi:hypothetical protein